MFSDEQYTNERLYYRFDDMWLNVIVHKDSRLHPSLRKESSPWVLIISRSRCMICSNSTLISRNGFKTKQSGQAR